MTPRSLAVVVPTITGREESLERILYAYEQTLRGREYELIVVRDEPSWPRACNVGYLKTSADVVHFGADDLEPLPGWWQAAMRWLSRWNELPAAKVYNADGEFDNAIDGNDKAQVWFTRVPIMRRDQYERIGPWPEQLTYYADVWVSEKAASLGIVTRILYKYAFVHHWSQIGRVDSQANLTRAWAELLRLRGGFVHAGD